MPAERAHAVLSEILRRSQARGFVPYLGVLKRHRPDPFWLPHAVDGLVAHVMYEGVTTRFTIDGVAGNRPE